MLWINSGPQPGSDKGKLMLSPALGIFPTDGSAATAPGTPQGDPISRWYCWSEKYLFLNTQMLPFHIASYTTIDLLKQIPNWIITGKRSQVIEVINDNQPFCLPTTDTDLFKPLLANTKYKLQKYKIQIINLMQDNLILYVPRLLWCVLLFLKHSARNIKLNKQIIT